MTAPIRVAHITGKMSGGGVEQVVMNYYRHIDRSKVQFDFLVDADSTLVPKEEIESLGGRVFVVPPYQHAIAYQKALASLFRSQGWRIVHSHINTLSVFPLWAAKRSGIPVRIAHSHATSGKGEIARNLMKYALRPFANHFPTHRLACSNYAGKWLFGAAKFKVVVNAFDLKDLAFSQGARIEFRQNLGIGEDTYVFGHAGRFAPPKNQARLIRLFSDVAATRPDALLVFAGQGPDMEACKDLACDLGLASKVIFIGQHQNMSAFYSGIDAFVLPSAYEGLGLALVEAQDAGLPCIASRTVSQEANPTHKVTFVAYDDDDAWKEAMRLSRVRSNRLLSASEREALSLFDISKAAVELMEFYLQCVKNTSSEALSEDA